GALRVLQAVLGAGRVEVTARRGEVRRRAVARLVDVESVRPRGQVGRLQIDAHARLRLLKRSGAYGLTLCIADLRGCLQRLLRRSGRGGSRLGLLGLDVRDLGPIVSRAGRGEQQGGANGGGLPHDSPRSMVSAAAAATAR